VYAPALLLVLALTQWPDVRSLPRTRKAVALLLFLAPQLTLAAWSWHEWGTPGGALTMQGVPLSTGRLSTGAVGLLFDRQSGLLAYAPLYWIVPACWWLTRRRTWHYAVPIATLYVPAAAFVMWWGGFAPAARFLVPAIPMAAVVIARALETRAIRVAAVTVTALQIPINALTWQRPRVLWPREDGTLALTALGWPGGLYAEVLPDVRLEGVGAGVAPALIVAVAVTLLLVAASRREVTPSSTP
jgi:hypothetical protein